MTTMLPSLAALVEDLRPVFSQPSFTTHCQLLLAWLLHLGKHTLFRTCGIINLQTQPDLSRRHAYDRYYNFFERSAGAPHVLAQRILLMIRARLPLQRTLTLLVDDTLSHKRGKSVWGLGWFRDAVASTQKRVATASGHNWVVIAVAFRSPLRGAPILAIPLLAQLHQAGEDHPGPSQLAKEMLAKILQWYPDHEITLVGDGAYASNELLVDLSTWVQFVGRMRSDAALYDPKIPPQPKSKRGPKPRKGPRLPNPKAAAARADRKRSASGDGRWQELQVQIYGQCKPLLALSYQAVWPRVLGYRVILVVVVRDPSGQMNDGYFFTTKLDASLVWVIEQYSWRWSIEVLFAGSKQVLDLEDPQHWCQSSVEKIAPWIWSVQSVLMVWYLTEGYQSDEAQEMRLKMGAWQTEWSLAQMRRVLVRCTWNHTINLNSGSTAELREFATTLKNWGLMAL